MNVKYFWKRFQIFLKKLETFPVSQYVPSDGDIDYVPHNTFIGEQKRTVSDALRLYFYCVDYNLSNRITSFSVSRTRQAINSTNGLSSLCAFSKSAIYSWRSIGGMIASKYPD